MIISSGAVAMSQTPLALAFPVAVTLGSESDSYPSFHRVVSLRSDAVFSPCFISLPDLFVDLSAEEVTFLIRPELVFLVVAWLIADPCPSSRAV